MLLSSSTCVMFILYFTAVVSSARYCPKPPSPVTATIARSGAAAHAAHCRGEAEADRSEVARHEHRLAGALEVPAERGGVVADVDRDDRVLGHEARHGVEHRRRVDSESSVVGHATRLLDPPDLPALGDLRPLVDTSGAG